MCGVGVCVCLCGVTVCVYVCASLGVCFLWTEVGGVSECGEFVCLYVFLCMSLSRLCVYVCVCVCVSVSVPDCVYGGFNCNDVSVHVCTLV